MGEWASAGNLRDDARQPSVYTVPFGRDLCDETAELILRNVGDDPLALSDAIILLPNNRAITAMREAFVRRAAPGLLMPRLTAIGDLALDETLGPLLDPIDGDAAIPVLIAPLHRQLILAEMIARQYTARKRGLEPTEAMRLARLMAQLIDELDIEQKTIADFQALSGESQISDDPDLAAHWQGSYTMLLEILPAYLAKMDALGAAGPAARRNILLARLAARMRAGAFSNPVFASGISTAAPAIADLLKAIARMERGHVILPPVDLAMNDADWEALRPPAAEDEAMPQLGRETHPQFHLKLLLDRMAVNRAEIATLAPESVAPRAEAIAQIFCLPEASRSWIDLPDEQKTMPNLRYLQAEDSAEEARSIALLIREALEKPERRVAIVTPDRELAVRISRQLKRWDINVDDSAGIPLLQTPPGTLLMACLSAAAQRFSPATILGIMKHPFVHQGERRLDWLAHVRALDLELRGPAEGLGLAAIGRQLRRRRDDEKRSERKAELDALIDWWNSVAQQLRPLEQAASGDVAALIEAVSALLGELTDGAVWRGFAGRQLAARFEAFAGEQFALLGKVNREALPALFAELCHGEVVRPPYGGHPRVQLLGLLEARLQQADIVICAGLNEGSWPQLPAPDPWLAPGIRRQLGLPGLERNIGLAAHDLSAMMGARECIITRAKRDRAGPSVSSRFLLRTQAFLGDRLTEESRAALYARALDRGPPVDFAAPPAVQPSAEQRKVSLSVTQFDRLIADPFAFYARKILRLSPLDEVNAEADAAWRGTMIHDLLEKWGTQDGCDPAKLMVRAERILSDADLHPQLRTLWVPRITEALQWVAQHTSDLSDDGRYYMAAEVEGTVRIDGVSVRGRADRIDKTRAGDLVIIDYKTGAAPPLKQIRAGYALQLGLLGYLAGKGAFADVTGIANGYEYWSFAKVKDGTFGSVSSAAGGNGNTAVAAEAIEEFMLNKARDAIAKWINGDAPFHAKLRPEFAPYNDFDQLSRLQEWDGRQSITEPEAD